MQIEKNSNSYKLKLERFQKPTLKVLLANILIGISYTIFAIILSEGYLKELVQLIQTSYFVFLVIIATSVMGLLGIYLISIVFEYRYDGDDEKVREEVKKLILILFMISILIFVLGAGWIYVNVTPDYKILIDPFLIGNASEVLSKTIFLWWYAILVIIVITGTAASMFIVGIL